MFKPAALKVWSELAFPMLKRHRAGHSDACKPSPGAAGRDQMTQTRQQP